MSILDKIIVNGVEYNIGGTGSGLTEDVKQALIQMADKVGYEDINGNDYYQDLYDALYPPVNLSSISCVYTQSGTVYTTDSLDSLKTDLVVTAHYSDSTTAIITNYTLSGTLVEGTSTITVTYGGKTTTFNVVVTVFTTSPRIAQTGVSWNSSYGLTNIAGGCVTEDYIYNIDVAALKESSDYDETNDYLKTSGSIFQIKYVAPNTQGFSWSGTGKGIVRDTNNTGLTSTSMGTKPNETTWANARYSSSLLNAGTIKLSFTLATADVESSYAYFAESAAGHIMPIGVNVGDVIFAGENTPYYGKRNIYD